MHGYMVTFFTHQGKRHKGKPLAEWLLGEARALGIRGATEIVAAEGFGHRGRLHSYHFFELANQPVEVVMALKEDDLQRVFARLRKENVHVFYVKEPVEFGVIGEPD